MAIGPSLTRTRILLAVLALVSLVALFTTRVSRKMPDFEVYATAGARALHAAPLYRAGDGHFQFKYLPAFAMLAEPLALMPEEAAKGFWFALSAVLMILLLGLSASVLPAPRRAPPWLVVLTFFAMAKFYAHELVLGQVNLAFAVVVVLGVLMLIRRRPAPAGLLLALGVVIKPYGLLFAPWLVTRPEKAPAIWMVAGLAAALLVPALRYGWAGNLALHADWWRTVTATTAPNLLNPDNVSIASLVTRWLGSGPATQTVTAAISILLVALIAITAAARGRIDRSDALEASLILLAIPLLSPQGWDYVLLIATPGVMLLIDRLGDVPGALRPAACLAVIVTALSIYDLMGRSLYGQFMALSGITLCALVEFAALLSLRFVRSA